MNACLPTSNEHQCVAIHGVGSEKLQSNNEKIRAFADGVAFFYMFGVASYIVPNLTKINRIPTNRHRGMTKFQLSS